MDFISKLMILFILYTETLRHIWVALTFFFQLHCLFFIYLLLLAFCFYRLDAVCQGVVYALVLLCLPVRNLLLKEA
jgi:hypothetical protein